MKKPRSVYAGGVSDPVADPSPLRRAADDHHHYHTHDDNRV